MNFLQRHVSKNVKNFVSEQIITTYVKPRKKGKLYKRKDGRLISHRALTRVVRKLTIEKANSL